MSQNSPTNSGAHEEIDLGSVFGVEKFQTAVDSVYKEATSHKAVLLESKAAAVGDVNTEEIFSVLEGDYRELKKMTNWLVIDLIPQDISPSESDLGKLQKLYDELLVLRNHIRATAASAAKAEAKRVIKIKPKAEEKTDQPNRKKIKVETKKDFDHTTLPNEVASGVIEDSVTSVAAETQSEKTKRTPADFVDRSATNNSPAEVMSASTVNNLSDVAKIEVMKSAEDEKKSHVASGWESEIGEERVYIDDAENGAAKDTSPSESSIYAAPLNKTSEQDEVSDQSVTIRELPNESDAALLWREVEQNQFYTSAERTDVANQYEVFLRSLASGKDSMEINREYEVLEERVTKLLAGPSPEVLLDRSKRIVTRIVIGTEPDSLTQTKALNLWDNLKNRSSESDVAARFSLYRELESHAKRSESEWLTICGKHLPVSGVSGITAATSLKEVLEQALDYHPVLLDSPKKHVLVNQLIRCLSADGDRGLLVRDVAEIRQLVRVIDVPAAHTNADGIISSTNLSADKAAVQIDPSVNSVFINKAESKTELDDLQGLSEAELEEMEALEMMEEDDFFSRPRQKTMSIQDDNGDGDVAISVSAEAAVNAKEPALPLEPQLVEIDTADGQSFSQTTAVNYIATHEPSLAASLEKSDAVNKAVHHTLPRPMKAKSELSPESLTAKFLQAELYQQFIAAHYHSEDTFEKLLDSTITSIEAESTDRFERWLRENYNSAFAFISDMTVEEVLELAVDRGVRSVLKEKEIKYETFVRWVDSIGDMQIIAGEDLDFLFGELFARWFIGIKMLDES